MGTILAIVAMVKWLVDGDLTAAIVCLAVGIILKGVVNISIGTREKEEDDSIVEVWKRMVRGR